MSKTFFLKLFVVFLSIQAIASSKPTSSCSVALQKLNRLVDSHTFEVRRDFSQYAELFPQSFLEHIGRLKRDDHWLDSGSGEGFAVEDFHNETVLHVPSFLKNMEASFWQPRRVLVDPSKIENVAKALNHRADKDKPKVTAVSLKMERQPPQISGSEFKTGRYFEEIPNSEFSPADIITDLYGVISYSPRVDEVLRKYHQILKLKGKAYIFIGDYVQVPPVSGILRVTKLGESKWYSPFVESEVRLRNGLKIGLLDWVKSLKGFSASLESREIELSPGLTVSSGSILRSSIVLEKTANSAEIPELRLIESTESKPPLRIFEEVEP